MHIFISKSVGGKIVPQQASKELFFRKLLNSYEELDLKFKVVIEVVEKNLNESQISLYNAFIIKASNHFGNTFIEMENILFRFFPKDDDESPLRINKWTSKELTSFIDQSSSLLAEQGFKFE